MEIIALLILIGIATGFFDTTLGAGGLISVPSLIFLGLPPNVAIATDRFGTLSLTFSSLPKFWKAKRIVWKYIPVFAAISLAGSLIGANILLSVDSSSLQKTVGILLIILLPLLLVKPHFGTKRIDTNNNKKAAGFILYFLIMIFAGFFGQGTGPLIFFTLVYFLGFTMTEVIGTGSIPWLVLAITSCIIFALNGLINFYYGIILFFSMSAGSYIGAHFAIKKGDVWIKRLFALFVIFSGIKLLFF